jgi:hypothetical protein
VWKKLLKRPCQPAFGLQFLAVLRSGEFLGRLVIHCFRNRIIRVPIEHGARREVFYCEWVKGIRPIPAAVHNFQVPEGFITRSAGFCYPLR